MPRPGESFWGRLKELDWVGVTLNAGMYTAFVIGLAIGGTVWPWNDGRTIGSLVAFGILLIAFSVQQKFCIFTTAEKRIFPTRFLRSKTFLLLYLAQTCVQTALAIPIYYIPLFFQFARAESAVTSAVRLVPFLIVNIVVVFANGALLPKLGWYMPWYVAAGVFNTVGGALFFATLKTGISTASIYGYSILLAVGTGLAQQAAYSVASAKAPNHVPDAIGFINSAQVGSVVVALTFTSLIFQNVGYHEVKDAVAGLGFSNNDIRAALGGARSRLFEEGVVSGEVRAEIETGVVAAIRWSFLPVLIAGVLGLAAGLMMKRERLFGASETEEKENGKGETRKAEEASTKEQG